MCWPPTRPDTRQCYHDDDGTPLAAARLEYTTLEELLSDERIDETVKVRTYVACDVRWSRPGVVNVTLTRPRMHTHTHVRAGAGDGACVGLQPGHRGRRDVRLQGTGKQSSVWRGGREMCCGGVSFLGVMVCI